MPKFCRRSRRLLVWLALVCPAMAQHDEQALARLVTRGEVEVQGQMRPYVVRHLPPASFPDLPEAVAETLKNRECLIPQTYQAHQPENVVRGSFERAGSQDWAVLCSSNGSVSLLVFFASAPGKAQVLATHRETHRLQPHNSTRVLGFDWGIDTASPEDVHDAQNGLSPRPAPADHDAVADVVVNRGTVYHYFKNGTWSLVELPE